MKVISFIKNLFKSDAIVALLCYDIAMVTICAKIIMCHAYTALNIFIMSCILSVNVVCILVKREKDNASNYNDGTASKR